MVFIFPEISKAFCLKIRLQVLVSESSILSKFMQGCKALLAKNRESLVDADLLLLAKNSAITNFSNLSSC